MTDKKKPTFKDPNEALKELERPAIKWKILAQIGLGFLVAWALVIGLEPWIGIWGIGAMGVVTVVAAGFGVYVWRMTRKSQRIVDILKSATDEAGRRAAIEQLKAQGGDKDALSALAQAQLVARDRPNEAIAVLEKIDLKKAPGVVQDDVRANLGLLYLMHNRTREARELANAIRLDRQPQPKAKAMYAAVVAEAQARTGAPEEAKKLLETYDPGDTAYGDVAAMLYRAQIFTYSATKNRGLAEKAMQRLASIDPNMVAAFAVKGSNPVLQKMAKQVLQSAGAIPRPQIRMKMR